MRARIGAGDAEFLRPPERLSSNGAHACGSWSDIRGSSWSGQIYRAMLWKFRRPMKTGTVTEDPDLLARTDEYNPRPSATSQDRADAQFLLDKPFSDVEGFAEHLIRAGTLVAAGRIRPGDTVVEVGSGHLLAIPLSQPLSVQDREPSMSPGRRSIGRKLFEREPSTDWSLDPQFAAYDGHHAASRRPMCGLRCRSTTRSTTYRTRARCSPKCTGFCVQGGWW